MGTALSRWSNRVGYEVKPVLTWCLGVSSTKGKLFIPLGNMRRHIALRKSVNRSDLWTSLKAKVGVPTFENGFKSHLAFLNHLVGPAYGFFWNKGIS